MLCLLIIYPKFLHFFSLAAGYVTDDMLPLTAERRIELIMCQIGEMKKMYTHLKSKVLAIDRQRKRHRRERDSKSIKWFHWLVAIVKSGMIRMALEVFKCTSLLIALYCMLYSRGQRHNGASLLLIVGMPSWWMYLRTQSFNWLVRQPIAAASAASCCDSVIYLNGKICHVLWASSHIHVQHCLCALSFT